MKNIVQYILATKIQAAIYQAMIESKKDIDFSSLDELSYAVACDSVRFLEDHKLIIIQAELLSDLKVEFLK